MYYCLLFADCLSLSYLFFFHCLRDPSVEAAAKKDLEDEEGDVETNDDEEKEEQDEA